MNPVAEGGTIRDHRLGVRRRNWSFLGLLPFLAYTGAFLLLPAASVLAGAFRGAGGTWTLGTIRLLAAPQYRGAFKTSITLSAITAFLGAVFGAFICWSAISLRRPRWLRGAMLTFSGLAAQFGGVPLAFMFIATLGAQGLVTKFVKGLGWDLYGSGFRLSSFAGLAIVYLYFQIPLMIVVIAPAFDGLRTEWREAAANLGASSSQFWRHIGIPALLPSLLGATILLFASAFSAYATAAALTSGQVNLVPVQIGSLLSGNVIADNANIGQALAAAMVVIVAAAMVGYSLLQRRATRWAR